MRWNSRSCYAVAALLAISGCQAPQVTPPSAALRQSLGVVAMLPAAEPTLAPVAPPSVVGAGEGAGAGALAGVAGGLGIGGELESGNQGDFEGVGLLIGLVLAPVTGAIGAIAGATMAHSEEEVAVAQEQIGSVWSSATPGADLIEAFVKRAHAKGWRTFAAGDESQPLMTTKSPESAAEEAPASKLQIAVEAMDLVYQGRFDPDIHVVLLTSARLSRVADDAELFRATWTILRKGKPYFTYAEQPQALQSLIDEAIAVAAESMATFLFATSTPVDARQDSKRGVIVIDVRGGSRGAVASQGGDDAVAAPESAALPPDGVIALSPSVSSKLQAYLARDPAMSSYFYVSLDGQSSGAYVCSNNCLLDLQTYSQATASIRAQAQAKSACERDAETACVMLFHQDQAKRPFTPVAS